MLANLQSALARWNASAETRAQWRVLRGLVVTMLPAIVASVLLPPRACVFAVILSAVLCYRASAPIQGQLFALNLQQANALIAIPLQLLFSAWAIVLLALDRPGQVSASLFSVLLLTFTAIAPLLRQARSTRTRRRFPFPIIYGAAAASVLALQIYCLWVTP